VGNGEDNELAQRGGGAGGAAARAACVALLLVWVSFVVMYAVGHAPFGQRWLTDTFVPHRLTWPFKYPRAVLRGVHIGGPAMVLFADYVRASTPERATIYFEVDPRGCPSETELRSKAFDNYAYFVYRVYPRRVYAATPGQPIRDPVLYPPDAIGEDKERFALRVKAEEVARPRTLPWLREHGFDYVATYMPYFDDVRTIDPNAVRWRLMPVRQR